MYIDFLRRLWYNIDMEIVEDDDYCICEGLEYEFTNIPGPSKKKSFPDMSVKPQHRGLYRIVLTAVLLGILAEAVIAVIFIMK